MKMYSYDIEVFPNMFAILLVEVGQGDLISKYSKYDIYNNNRGKNDVIKALKKELFVIYEGVNDIHRLYEFINKKEEIYLVGFNSSNYDSIILDYILGYYHQLKQLSISKLTNVLKELNDKIIGNNDTLWFELRKELSIPSTRSYMDIDLQSLNNIHKLPTRISLKQCAISIKWYKIEDYDMPKYTRAQFEYLYHPIEHDLDTVNRLHSFNRYVHPDEFNTVIDYLYNDVFITDRLLEESMDELSSRIAILAKYGLYLLSSPRSGVANRIMSRLYSNSTGLRESEFKYQRTWRDKIYLSSILHSNIQFETDIFNKLVKEIADTVIIPMGGKSFNPSIIFKNKKYQLGLGGLHSVDLGGVFESTDDLYVYDADVDSYYPKSIVEYKIKPQHLSQTILSIISNLLYERLHYKKIKDKTNAEIYKIVINAGTFGKLGDANSFMKDDLAMYEVTVNNQLYLLMLVEQLELNGFSVISANTDGVTAIVPKDKTELYNSILSKWMKDTKFTLEVNKYIKYVRSSINDYVAKVETPKGHAIKRKGDFDSKKYKNLAAGYSYPIVPKALEEYYLNNVPIEETIYNATDILDFCMSQRTGSNFINEAHYILNGKPYVDTLTKTLRYYASNEGVTLLKVNKLTNSKINILAGKRVTLLNKLKPYTDIKDYNIDYRFYTGKVQGIISKVNNSITAKMKKNTGSLFDNLDDE